MDVWEFCSMFHRFGVGFEFEPSSIRKDVGDISHVGKLEVANRLGRQGWELVSVIVLSEDFEGVEFYFKRRSTYAPAKEAPQRPQRW